LELNQSRFLSILKDSLKKQLSEAVMFVPQILNKEHSDPEPVHKTRVGFRKIRTQLRILKPIVQKKTLRYFRSTSKQIGQTLGFVRDLDILKLNLSTYYTDHHPEKDFEKFLWKPTFLDIYNQTYMTLQITLKSREFVDFINFFTSFCSTEDLGIRKSIYKNSDSRLNPKEFISNVLFLQATIVQDTEKFLKNSQDDRMFHRLRIEVKRFRYILEFFSPFLEENRYFNLLSSLTNLQDHLGAINDFVTSINLVNSILIAKNNQQPSFEFSLLNNFKQHIKQEKIILQKSFSDSWDFYVQTNPTTLLSDCIRD
jgi:CHAD domain-containing protein